MSRNCFVSSDLGQFSACHIEQGHRPVRPALRADEEGVREGGQSLPVCRGVLCPHSIAVAPHHREPSVQSVIDGTTADSVFQQAPTLDLAHHGREQMGLSRPGHAYETEHRRGTKPAVVRRKIVLVMHDMGWIGAAHECSTLHASPPSTTGVDGDRYFEVVALKTVPTPAWEPVPVIDPGQTDRGIVTPPI